MASDYTAQDTQHQLNDLLIPVDYGALVNRSLAGDRDALVSLIKLGDQTNGAVPMVLVLYFR